MESAARPHPIRLAALLALLAMFGPFAIDAFFPAFHAIERELGANAWQMQQTISIYLIAYAAMSLFHGPLSDAYGRRVVILAGVAGFTAASVGCALASDIEALWFWRAMQGVFIGAGLIVGRAVVRDLYDTAQALKVQSLVSMFFSIAPVVAPIVGGIVYQALGWRAVFHSLAVYGGLLFLLCWRSVPETHPPVARTPFRPGPLARIYGEIARDGRYLLLALATGCNFGAFFLYISSAPAFVERVLALGTLDYAWFFGPAIVGMMTGSALANRFAGRVPARRTVRIGYAVMAVATLANLAYNAMVGAPRAPVAVLPIALLTVGVSLAFPTLSLKMLDRYPRNRGAASSVQGAVWGAMTALIAGVASPIAARSGVGLAVGAASLTLAGFLCWYAYARLTPAPAQPSAGSTESPPAA